MAASVAIPVDEYLRTRYRPDCEYVDGRLVERNVGDYFHSRMQGLIAGLLCSRERDRGFHALIAPRVEVRPRTRYRVPDICVKARPYRIAPVVTAPELAIEILAPDDNAVETLARISDYAGTGSGSVWLIDSVKRRVFVADNSGIREIENLIVSMDLVGSVDFNELFRQLDE